MLLVLAAAPAAQAGFGCAASAGRVSVLGLKAIEPVRAGGVGDCAGETTSLGGARTGLPDPVAAGAVVAATEVYPVQKAVLASGGVADLAVRALPTLPITLPQVTVPDALKSVSVDLSAVKNAVNAIPGIAAVDLSNVRGQIPSTVSVDLGALLNTLLPNGKLPNVELLHVRGAMAYAVGSCQSGAPVVGSSSTVAGVSILGTPLLGDTVDKVVSLIDTATLDPGKVDLSWITTSALGLSPKVSALLNTVGIKAIVDPLFAKAIDTAVSTYDKLPAVRVLDPTLAQIKVTPGLRVRTATSVTQQALNVSVTIAGQKIVDAVVGQAQASVANVDCSDPVADPTTPAGATLQCSTRKLVLVDVLERGGHVKLFGVADPALAGRRVSIVFAATGHVVARARVSKDGLFDTLAPLPPHAIRDSNRARYLARLGKERSINLKLRRRMVITSMSARNGNVTIAGRVLPPLGTPVKAITLTRRTSCRTEKVVTRFHPRKNGHFRITVKAPKGAGTAVYRMTTRVRNSFAGHSLFDTFTLPRAVDLQ